MSRHGDKDITADKRRIDRRLVADEGYDLDETVIRLQHSLPHKEETRKLTTGMLEEISLE